LLDRSDTMLTIDCEKLRFDQASKPREFAQKRSDDSPVENQFGNPVILPEGADCYRIDYSGVVRKSRCVGGIGYIACDINIL
jgi:hypothetical protein